MPSYESVREQINWVNEIENPILRAWKYLHYQAVDNGLIMVISEQFKC